MNREILFKAKRIDNGEWVEGFFFKYEGKCYITNTSETYISVIYTEESVTDFNLRAYEVDPETVCQYTGLTDKNGKAIWENNKCCVQGTGVLAYGTIKYLEGCFCFVEDKTKNILRLFDIKINGYSIKVEGKYIFDKT